MARDTKGKPQKEKKSERKPKERTTTLDHATQAIIEALPHAKVKQVEKGREREHPPVSGVIHKMSRSPREKTSQDRKIERLRQELKQVSKTPEGKGKIAEIKRQIAEAKQQKKQAKKIEKEERVKKRTVVTIFAQNPRDPVPVTGTPQLATLHTVPAAKIPLEKNTDRKILFDSQDRKQTEDIEALNRKTLEISRLDKPTKDDLRLAGHLMQPLVVVTPNTNIVLQSDPHAKGEKVKKTSPDLIEKTLASIDKADADAWKKVAGTVGIKEAGGKPALTPQTVTEATHDVEQYKKLHAENMADVLKENLPGIKVNVLEKGAPIKLPSPPPVAKDTRKGTQNPYEPLVKEKFHEGLRKHRDDLAGQIPREKPLSKRQQEIETAFPGTMKAKEEEAEIGEKEWMQEHEHGTASKPAKDVVEEGRKQQAAIAITEEMLAKARAAEIARMETEMGKTKITEGTLQKIKKGD